MPQVVKGRWRTRNSRLVIITDCEEINDSPGPGLPPTARTIWKGDLYNANGQTKETMAMWENDGRYRTPLGVASHFDLVQLIEAAPDVAELTPEAKAEFSQPAAAPPAPEPEPEAPLVETQPIAPVPGNREYVALIEELEPLATRDDRSPLMTLRRILAEYAQLKANEAPKPPAAADETKPAEAETKPAEAETQQFAATETPAS